MGHALSVLCIFLSLKKRAFGGVQFLFLFLCRARVFCLFVIISLLYIKKYIGNWGLGPYSMVQAAG